MTLEERLKSKTTERYRGTNEWREGRRQEKQSRQENRRSSDENCIADNRDVLFGRSNNSYNWPGNAQLYKLVLAKRDEYDSIPAEICNEASNGKKEIVDAIVDAIERDGRRFLIPKFKEEKISDPQSMIWLQAIRDEAYEKVSAMFRYARKAEKNGATIGVGVERAQQQGVQSATSDEICAAADEDVLFGKSYKCQTWAGNVKFKELVLAKKDEHDKLPKQEKKRKRELVNSIVDEIEQAGGRFLRPKNEEEKISDLQSMDWVRATPTVTYGKVSERFRSLTKAKKKKSKRKK